MITTGDFHRRERMNGSRWAGDFHGRGQMGGIWWAGCFRIPVIYRCKVVNLQIDKKLTRFINIILLNFVIQIHNQKRRLFRCLCQKVIFYFPVLEAENKIILKLSSQNASFNYLRDFVVGINMQMCFGDLSIYYERIHFDIRKIFKFCNLKLVSKLFFTNFSDQPVFRLFRLLHFCKSSQKSTPH